MLVEFNSNQRTRIKSRRCWHVQQQLQLQLPSCCMWFTQSDVAAILSPTCHGPQSNTWTNTWHLHWSSELVTNRMAKLLQIPFGQLRSFRHTLYTARLKWPAAHWLEYLMVMGCSAQRAQAECSQVGQFPGHCWSNTPDCHFFTSHQT